MSSIYDGLVQSSGVCPVSTVFLFNHQMYVQYLRWSCSIIRCMSSINSDVIQSSGVCPISTVMLFNHQVYVQYLRWSSSIIMCTTSIYSGLLQSSGVVQYIRWSSSISGVCPVSTVVLFNHQVYVQYQQ